MTNCNLFHLISLEQIKIDMKFNLRLVRACVVCIMVSLMALSCTKRESDVTAGTVSVNLDSALPLKEAALLG